MDRAEILKLLRERIVRFAASRLRGDVAEDLAQEVLLVIHEKYSSLERIEDILPVAFEISRLKIWAFRRKTLRRGEDKQIPVDDLPLAIEGDDPFKAAAFGERLQHLQSALLEMGERCRELFRLKLEGYTFPEIQKRLDAGSLNTLYTWDLRCRKQLHARLEKYERES